jgi:hypothetical protein
VKESAPDYEHVPLANMEILPMNLKIQLALKNVQQLEIVVAIHAQIGAPVEHLKAHIDRQQRIERPGVNSLGIHQRLDY